MKSESELKAKAQWIYKFYILPLLKKTGDIQNINKIKKIKKDKKRPMEGRISPNILDPFDFDIPIPPIQIDDYIPIPTQKKIEKMDYLEINTKLKEAEDTIKLLKKALSNSNVELQDWEIHHGRGMMSNKNFAKFYIKEKNSYKNVCEVYGGKEKGAQTSLIISKVPQMLSIINELADRKNHIPTTIVLLSKQAVELQKLIQ